MIDICCVVLLNEQKLLIRPTTISRLPDELLLCIFSYLSGVELQGSAMGVCRRWARVAVTPCLWHTVRAGPEVSTGTLLRWLDTAGRRLRSLKIKRRNDADEVLRKVTPQIH